MTINTDNEVIVDMHGELIAQTGGLDGGL